MTPRFISVRAYNGRLARQIPDRPFESRPPVILLITPGLSRSLARKCRGARHSTDRSITQNACRKRGDPRTGPSIAHGGGSRFAITPNMQLPSKWISTHPPQPFTPPLCLPALFLRYPYARGWNVPSTSLVGLFGS